MIVLLQVPRILTDSVALGWTAVVVALVVTAALMIGDVLGRKSVTVLDVIVIAPFFLIVGACTPVGQGIARLVGTIHLG